MNKFYDFMNADWKQMFIDRWNSISPVSKQAFIWIFSIVNLVFLWHTITFFFGNHDWGQIKYGVHFCWSLFDGRWGAGLIQQVVGGDILPVWNNLFCFAGFTLATIFLAKYWELPKNAFTYTIFGLFIILMPYTPPWLQFVRSETHFWNIFLIVISLVLCSYKKLWAYLLAFLLLYFCLGCYAAMLPAMFIIFFGRCILDVWFDNKTPQQLIKDRWQTFCIIILSFAAFTVTWLLMKKFGVIIPMPTVENVGLSTLLSNFAQVGIGIRDSFLHPLPYIPTGFKILLGLAIPIVIWLMKNYSKEKAALLFTLFLGVIVSTQITNLLSVADYSNQLRIDFFAMPYTYALFWTILLRTGKCCENFAILFMCIAIFYSSLQDIRDQKVKYFDKLHDVRIYEDVISRIKSNPNFNSEKRYNLFIVGEVERTWETTTFDKYNSKMSWENAWAPFVPNWNAKEYFDFYEKHSYINFSYDNCTVPLSDEDLIKMDTDYLLNKAAPYPNLNSTHIDNENIYIIFQQEELENLKGHIKNIQ